MFLCGQGPKQAAGGLCLLTTKTSSNVRDNFPWNSQQWWTHVPQTAFLRTPLSPKWSPNFRPVTENPWKKLKKDSLWGCHFLCHLSPLPGCDEQVMTAHRCCKAGGIAAKKSATETIFIFSPFKRNLVYKPSPAFACCRNDVRQGKCALFMPLKHAAWLHSAPRNWCFMNPGYCCHEVKLWNFMTMMNGCRFTEGTTIKTFF